MQLNVTTENMLFFKCLSSETRVQIIQLLSERAYNLRELAALLNLSPGIITRHIDMLEECGIIWCENISGKRGVQKVCRLALEQASLTFQNSDKSSNKSYVLSIPVGLYSGHDVQATCGLCSVNWIIGLQDDPRYFSAPEHQHAGLVWFSSGWVEYRIPCYTFATKKVKSIKISMELCSEAPDYNDNYPSDIYFSFNGKEVGYWTSPGDFGSKRGRYTPWWWVDGCQYGMLKTLYLTEEGVMLDGTRISDLTLNEILGDRKQDLMMRISSPADAQNPGGVTIHGRGFGNYDRDIEVVFEYE